jgi:FKBP-type peptidyl-prolyl cis-trans isomerase (trigger factor)
MEPDVRRKLAHRLFLTEAIKQEGLEPSDEEIQKQMEIYRQAFSEGKIEKSKEVKSFEEVLHNLAANDVLARLIVQRVVQIGRGLTTALPKS